MKITSVKTISERLKEAREAAGLTQLELAAKAGVSPGTIGNLEAGTRKNPRELLAIAKAVGVRAEWLRDGKEPISSSECTLAPSYSSHIEKVPLWPFSRISPDEWGKLPEDEKNEVEILIKAKVEKLGIKRTDAA